MGFGESWSAGFEFLWFWAKTWAVCGELEAGGNGRFDSNSFGLVCGCGSLHALACQAAAMQRPSIWLPAREQHDRAEKLIGYWAYEGTLHRCSLLSCSVGARASLARQKR